MDAAGNYTLATGAAFGPALPVWTYTATPPANFHSAEISGAQRLPNGNTLICEGIKGNLFEVTSAGQTVWRYMCPVTTTIMTQGDAIPIDPARPVHERRALQGHAQRADLDQHRQQPQHRHAGYFHGHQRRATRSAARLLSSAVVTLISVATLIHRLVR